MRPSRCQVFKYQDWIHAESHPQPEIHAAHTAQVVADWLDNYKAPSYDDLCQWPAFVVQDNAPSPWLQAVPAAVAGNEGESYRAKYENALQRRFTTQQTHVHMWDSKQQRPVPLPSCRKKNAPGVCKHGFPKLTTGRDRYRVICRGNARKYSLSTRGRRNMLGSILAPRETRGYRARPAPSPSCSEAIATPG